ncbi:unnamed protein product, partial [Brassica oleracea var. botrytis]
MEFLHNSTFGKIMAVEKNLHVLGFRHHYKYKTRPLPKGPSSDPTALNPQTDTYDHCLPFSKSKDHLILDHGKEQSQQLSLAPGPSADFSDYLVLAAHRTKRPNILRAFKPYRGGWIITN